ncbi:lytic polysaccharide monooxygenase [Sporormia fimetaria CBS 119925]|uniref:Lytic polysaccharide monooxygenase n=1 Tax=Sporormia fimetaria CBS 119925 TaxID=1340428 RepID=A0A6A6VK77_9PLEO|nr:lytic polysaccharide monooxygenase [Sporormia fimetaria CBS 119925]
MRSTTVLIALTSSLVPAVSAHGHVRGVTVNGKWTPGADPVWYYNPNGVAPNAGWKSLNQDNGFVEPSAMASADVNCHKSATPGQTYIDVNAGQEVKFYWNTWPDSHKGPIINYIAPCDGDCTTKSAQSLRWTKISQGAIVSGNTWVTDQMLTNNFTSTTTIPRNLKAGNYVIRHEIIALHGAQNVNGAQLYPQCLNLRVGGSGSVAPSGGVPGTSLYRNNEPGIIFNLYTGQTSYTFPGPAVWTGAN